MSKTTKTTPIAAACKLGAAIGRDAAHVLYDAYCERREDRDYTAAERRADGAAAYGRACDALAPHAPEALLNALDEAHGAALVKMEQVAFMAGLSAGVALAGGAR